MTYSDIPVTPEEDAAFEELDGDLALRTEVKRFHEALVEYLDEIRDTGCGSEDCPGCATLQLKIPKGRN
jgi:hypothetical protein